MSKIEEKYCLYMDKNVISSGWNNYGTCVCLTCNKEKCDDNCDVAKNRHARRRMMGTNSFGITSVCNECLDAKIYEQQQR